MLKLQAGCSITQAVRHQIFTAVHVEINLIFYLIFNSILFDPLLLGIILALLAIGLLGFSSRSVYVGFVANKTTVVEL